MRVLHAVVLFFGLVALPMVGHAATPPRQDLNKILMSRYEVIAGAWYLDVQCHVLPAADAALFEKYVGALNVYAQKEGLAPTPILLQMQQNGKLGAMKYKACPPEASNIVEAAFMLSGMLYQDLIVPG